MADFASTHPLMLMSFDRGIQFSGLLLPQSCEGPPDDERRKAVMAMERRTGRSRWTSERVSAEARVLVVGEAVIHLKIGQGFRFEWQARMLWKRGIFFVFADDGSMGI